MPCLAHLDVNSKSTRTNRNCKFIDNLKEDQEAGYKLSIKKKRDKGGKRKESIQGIK
jgi:hypothetical protein